MENERSLLCKIVYLGKTNIYWLITLHSHIESTLKWHLFSDNLLKLLKDENHVLFSDNILHIFSNDWNSQSIKHRDFKIKNSVAYLRQIIILYS